MVFSWILHDLFASFPPLPFFFLVLPSSSFSPSSFLHSLPSSSTITDSLFASFIFLSSFLHTSSLLLCLPLTLPPSSLPSSSYPIFFPTSLTPSSQPPFTRFLSSPFPALPPFLPLTLSKPYFLYTSFPPNISSFLLPFTLPALSPAPHNGPPRLAHSGGGLEGEWSQHLGRKLFDSSIVGR